MNFLRALLAVLTMWGAAACTVPAINASSAVPGAYSAALALLSNVADDFELNTSYRSPTNLACKRVISCVGALYVMTNTYQGCTSIPGVLDLSGTTEMILDDVVACGAFGAGNLPGTPYGATKKYTNYLRTDSRGTTSFTATQNIRISYENGAWEIAIPELRRTTVSGTTTVEDYSLLSTEDVEVSGQRALGTRRISSGEMRVGDFVGNVTFEFLFDGIDFENASCCYPTSGSITGSEIEGATTVPQSMTFKNTACGAYEFIENSVTTAGTLSRACE